MTALAHQGNPELVVWCEKCACTVVPLDNGRCGWCSTIVAERPGRGHVKRTPPKPRPKKPAPPLLDESTDVDDRVAALIDEAAVRMTRDGKQYATQYRRWWLNGRNGRPPKAPAALLGPAAQLIRGLVVDESAALLTYGRRRAA